MDDFLGEHASHGVIIRGPERGRGVIDGMRVIIAPRVWVKRIETTTHVTEGAPSFSVARS